MIGPGKTIGILGGGQLGRMLSQAAQSLGYSVHVFEPSGSSPAAAVADCSTRASYGDTDALEAFAGSVDVVTYEFENIPVEALEMLAGRVELHPAPEVLRTCQNRRREKAWLRDNGFPHAAFAEAMDGDIEEAVRSVGLPCVVKTADFGYDGKGQMRIGTADDLVRAAAIFRGRRCVVERWIDFEREISVICPRTRSGETRPFPAAENIHANHVLDVSLVPARVDPRIGRSALELAAEVTDRLGVVGLLAVEMFLTRAGELVVNELAPRPHNSGHWSLDGGRTSQFEQHVRALCGLPLGPAEARSPTVMVNVMGEAWKWHEGSVAGEPNWLAILAEPRAKLHLYGKPEPRPGRKMGHFSVVGEELEETFALALRLKAALQAA
ncbi:MAG TPA: 5-(carboxyamino)imidazole ribonucleotide synthase [Opitutaceae bacterium]